MGLKHEFFAVYGAELVGVDWPEVDNGLEEMRRARGRDAGSGGAGEDVGLFLVQGDDDVERVVIGVVSEDLPPGTCRPVGDFTSSPGRDAALRAAAALLGARVVAGPGWLVVHDWS
ncbi:hypothetical protein GCM10020000_88060 [Streptomyces olivoverticillatus]